METFSYTLFEYKNINKRKEKEWYKLKIEKMNKFYKLFGLIVNRENYLTQCVI